MPKLSPPHELAVSFLRLKNGSLFELVENLHESRAVAIFLADFGDKFLPVAPTAQGLKDRAHFFQIESTGFVS